MDDSQRTVLIDDSHSVGQIIKVICARINLSNPDEFSLTGGCIVFYVHVRWYQFAALCPRLGSMDMPYTRKTMGFNVCSGQWTSWTAANRRRVVSMRRARRRGKRKPETTRRCRSCRRSSTPTTSVCPTHSHTHYLLPRRDESALNCLSPIAVNWLNHDKSLREQGVGENDTVRLRKKFFFSDQNVDRNDPVQLNLMYVQVCIPPAWPPSHASDLLTLCECI